MLLVKFLAASYLLVRARGKEKNKKTN
jgi:hypothetical protein